MTKLSCRLRQPTPPAPQMPIIFPTKDALDHQKRADVVALLGRLLLQVARADEGSEVRDDAP